MHESMRTYFNRTILFAFIVCIASTSLRAENPLAEQMSVMKRAFRGLKAAMEAPAESDKAEYIAFADDLREAAVKSKDCEPDKVSTVPENEREQFLADYRQSLDNLIVLIDKLKTQLDAGDWDAARGQIKLINRAQGEGHEKFRSE